MTIAEELRVELKDALRQRDVRRTDVIRQIETEISKAKSAPGFSATVDDALYRQVIAAYVKQMNKAHREYLELGERGAEMAEKLAFEVNFLSRWLPKKLDEQATRAAVKAAIERLGVSDPKMAGRVTGQVIKQLGKDADGGLVARLVREELA